MQNTGDLIRTRRKELGYTAASLANQLGITTQAVVNWESQGRSPSKALLPKIAAVLGLRVEELLGATEVRLSLDETKLLNAFRQLPKLQQTFLLKMLSGLMK